jgi:hypothetical protein
MELHELASGGAKGLALARLLNMTSMSRAESSSDLF